MPANERNGERRLVKDAYEKTPNTEYLYALIHVAAAWMLFTPFRFVKHTYTHTNTHSATDVVKNFMLREQHTLCARSAYASEFFGTAYGTQRAGVAADCCVRARNASRIASRRVEENALY